MFALLLSFVTATPAALPAASDSVANGYYALLTTINDSPAQIGVRISRPDGALLAEVYPATGGGPIRAREVKLDGANLRIVAVVHEGFELTLNLTFDGDDVRGTWSAGGEQQLLGGRRAPGPNTSAAGTRDVAHPSSRST